MRWLAALTIIAVMGALALEGFSTTRHWKRKRQHDAGRKEAVLWRDPGNIRHRDLYYGPDRKIRRPSRHSGLLKKSRKAQIRSSKLSTRVA
jgi:hypothetical protein